MQNYVRSDSVVSRVIAGETLVVPVRRGVGDLASIYTLNEVGTCIWAELESPRSKSEIVNRVESEFDGNPGQIECDVNSFLDEMHSAGLLTLAETAAP